MARACARCGLTLPGRFALRMVWCPHDRCYYCGQCFREACLPVHGTTPAVRAQTTLLAVAVLVFVGPILLFPGVALLLLSTPPGSLAGNGVWGALLIAVVLVPAAGLAAGTMLRGRVHRRTIREHPPSALDTSAERPDSHLPWKPNRVAPARRSQLLWASVGFVVVADVAILGYYVASGSSGIALQVAMILGLIAGLGGCAALFALLPLGPPSQVAVARDGIHFWYDSAYLRHSQTSVMEWSRLNMLGRSGPALGDPAKRIVGMMRIDPENARDVQEAWQTHRISTDVPPRVAEAASSLPSAAPLYPRASEVIEAREPLPAAAGAAPDRGTMCARCHVRFPGYEGLRLYWCSIDRFYVCRRCWEDGCQEGHGRGLSAVSKSYRVVTAALIVVLLLGLWYPAVLYDYRLTDAWQSAGTSSIASLQAGQLAKVAGTIVSSNLVAWGGHEVYGSSTGWDWLWNSTDTFEVADVSGRILVTTEAWYVIYNGPWYATYAQHTQMTVYHAGDLVQIVGTVGTLANGVLHLQAQIMSSLDAVPLITLGPSGTTVFFLYALPITMGLAAVSAGWVLGARRRAHRRAVRGQPAQPIATTVERKDPSLPWQPNGRGTSPRRRLQWAGVFVLGALALLALFPGYAPRPETGYFSLGLVGSAVLGFDALIVYLLLFGNVGHPSYVAVAEDGFRLWYDSPYDQHLNDTVFPWSEIRDIHMTGGKGAHWVLSWVGGENTNLYMLNGRSLSLLLNEWTKRRTPDGG